MAMNTGYIIGFAAAICVVCSLGVAGASMGLRPLQQANETAAFQKNILKAVDLPSDELGKDELQARFDQRLKLILVDDEGKEVHQDLATSEEKKDKLEALRKQAKAKGESVGVYPVYLRVAEGGGDAVEAYAIELQGKGLWGPISGYIALEKDGKTVLNVAFDAPKETPGLGAEITTDKFKSQWVGKKIADAQGLEPIAVPKTCAGQDPAHCVDGVSGATITSRGVDEMVERAVTTEYDSYLTQIQKAGG